MNWSRAKTIAIFFFVALNISLATLVYIEGRQFVLSNAHQQAITQVLADHEVSLGSSFVFMSHAPQRRMTLTDNNLNNRALVSLFMSEPVGIHLEQTATGEIFATANERVVFEHERLRYSNLGLDLHFATETDKRLRATQTIRGLGDAGRYFSLDINTLVDGTGQLAYRQIYRHRVIESNYMIFSFESGALTEVVFNFRPVTGFFGEARALRTTDEILLIAMRHLRELSAEPLTITQMDVVYRADAHGEAIANPYYRVFVDTQAGQTKTLLINAYTGDIARD